MRICSVRYGQIVAVWARRSRSTSGKFWGEGCAAQLVLFQTAGCQSSTCLVFNCISASDAADCVDGGVARSPLRRLNPISAGSSSYYAVVSRNPVTCFRSAGAARRRHINDVILTDVSQKRTWWLRDVRVWYIVARRPTDIVRSMSFVVISRFYQ